MWAMSTMFLLGLIIGALAVAYKENRE